MVFTGTNRSRWTSISAAPRTPRSPRPSRSRSGSPRGWWGRPGSTVLVFLIIARPRMPSRRSSSSRSATRSNHRLLVEQNRCRDRSASASLSSSRVCAVSRSTIRPSLRRRAKWPPLRSRRGTADRLDRERRPRPREPLGHPGVRDGAEVVGVGHERLGVAGLDQPVEQPAAAQRGVDVAVPRRAPLQVGVLLPLDRGQVVGAELGLLVLQEVQRQVVDGQVGVAREHGEGVVARCGSCS